MVRQSTVHTPEEPMVVRKTQKRQNPTKQQNKKAQGPTSAEKRQLKGKTKAKLGHSPQLSSSCYLAGEVLNYGLGD